jgi:hypothetical protein
MFAANTGGGPIDVVLGGTQIPLPNLQNLDDFVPNGTNTEFEVPETGKYYISYEINLTLGVLVGSRVTVNGSSIPASEISPILATEYRASFITDLVAGDTISLELFGLLGAAILRSGVGNSLTVIRLA